MRGQKVSRCARKELKEAGEAEAQTCASQRGKEKRREVEIGQIERQSPMKREGWEKGGEKYYFKKEKTIRQAGGTTGISQARWRKLEKLKSRKKEQSLKR